MWPTLLEVQTAMGPLPVNTYGLFMTLAFSGAFAIIHFRARMAGVNPDRLIAGYVAAAIGGMIGARLLYAATVDWERTITDPMSLMSCAGFAVYGGILGGIVGVGIFVFASGLPAWVMSDLAAPGVVLGMGLGRIGCFFSGCCHGSVAPTPQNPIGLLPSAFTGGQIWLSSTVPFVTNQVHGGVGRIHDVPIYPTQMWDATALLVLAGVLIWAWPRRKFDGQIAALTLIFQPPIRAFVESFRADERGYALSFNVSDRVAAMLPPGMSQAGDSLTGHVAGITTSQGFAIVFVIAGLALYAYRRNAGLAVATPVAASDDADLLEELA